MKRLEDIRTELEEGIKDRLEALCESIDLSIIILTHAQWARLEQETPPQERIYDHLQSGDISFKGKRLIRLRPDIND